jgi:hypothetical protein
MSKHVVEILCFLNTCIRGTYTLLHFGTHFKFIFYKNLTNDFWFHCQASNNEISNKTSFWTNFCFNILVFLKTLRKILFNFSVNNSEIIIHYKFNKHKCHQSNFIRQNEQLYSLIRWAMSGVTFTHLPWYQCSQKSQKIQKVSCP